MAGATKWKIYDKAGTYQAACKEVEAAAVLVAFYGDGSTIRSGHSWIMWREGAEETPAAESYEEVARTVTTRAAIRRIVARVPPHDPGAK